YDVFAQVEHISRLKNRPKADVLLDHEATVVGRLVFLIPHNLASRDGRNRGAVGVARNRPDRGVVDRPVDGGRRGSGEGVDLIAVAAVEELPEACTDGRLASSEDVHPCRLRKAGDRTGGVN